MPPRSRKQPSEQELRRRKQQSQRDKAAHAQKSQQSAARRPPGRRARPANGQGRGTPYAPTPQHLYQYMLAGRRAQSGRGTLRSSGAYKRALLELKRGLPFTTPTRLELINTRVRFSVTRNENHPRLSILFHPARSTTHLLALNHLHDPAIGSTARGDGTTSSGFTLVAKPFIWNGPDATLADGETDAVTTVSITSSDFEMAQAVGAPSTLISPLTRVTGGVLTVRFTCGPGTTGYVAFSCPLVTELLHPTGVRDLYSAHATNPRIRRIELSEGTHTHHFVAPIVSPPAMEVFDTSSDRFSWGPDDAFGGTLLTFHDINYASNMGVPIVVELYATVGLQCRLEVDDRHLATSHASSTKGAKLAHGSTESPHLGKTTGGMEDHVSTTLSTGARDRVGIR
jgi:hypothetical protein